MPMTSRLKLLVDHGVSTGVFIAVSPYCTSEPVTDTGASHGVTAMV